MKREEAIYCLKAQSERYSEVCEECPLYGQTGVDHCCEDALQLAITALENQPVWIPVSERLPEEPDKVVQQLEERTAFLKDCTKYGNKTAEQQSKSYDTMMMYEVKDLVDDLLEIVKAGGADAEH